METIIYWIKEQVFETIRLIQEFFKGIHLGTLFLSFVLFYIIFLRRWEFKKILSFSFVSFLLFVILVHFEAFLFSTFGTEGSHYTIAISRIVFFFLISIVFIYNATLKE